MYHILLSMELVVVFMIDVTDVWIYVMKRYHLYWKYKIIILSDAGYIIALKSKIWV